MTLEVHLKIKSTALLTRLWEAAEPGNSLDYIKEIMRPRSISVPTTEDTTAIRLTALQRQLHATPLMQGQTDDTVKMVIPNDDLCEDLLVEVGKLMAIGGTTRPMFSQAVVYDKSNPNNGPHGKIVKMINPAPKAL